MKKVFSKENRVNDELNDKLNDKLKSTIKNYIAIKAMIYALTDCYYETIDEVLNYIQQGKRGDKIV